MSRDPLGPGPPPLQELLDALDDPDCRAILRQLEEPMTASELSEACGIPSSTTYRKVERLLEASLIEERTEIRADGHHTARYAPVFEAVRIGLDEDRSFEVEIERPTRTPDERLSELWAEVRKEA